MSARARNASSAGVGSRRTSGELKAFKRIGLKPGETQTVSFSLGPDELRYWSSFERKWVQEAEAFDVWVGPDSTAKLHAGLAVVR